MNKEDYFKYYIQGSDHYLIPKYIFNELFNEMNNCKEESKQLKEQLEKSEKARKEAIDKLKKWGEEPDYDMYMKMKDYKEHKEVLNILDIDKGE